MEATEERTLGALKQHRREFFDPTITKYGGRIFKVMGDGCEGDLGACQSITGGSPAQTSLPGLLQRMCCCVTHRADGRPAWVKREPVAGECLVGDLAPDLPSAKQLPKT
jgi:hypothetical protein